MAPAVWSRLSSYLLVLSLASSTLAQATAAAPGQPTRTNAPIGGFEEIGDSIASAQQVSLFCSIFPTFFFLARCINSSKWSGVERFSPAQLMSVPGSRGTRAKPSWRHFSTTGPFHQDQFARSRLGPPPQRSAELAHYQDSLLRLSWYIGLFDSIQSI